MSGRQQERLSSDGELYISVLSRPVMGAQSPEEGGEGPPPQGPAMMTIRNGPGKTPRFYQAPDRVEFRAQIEGSRGCQNRALERNKRCTHLWLLPPTMTGPGPDNSSHLITRSAPASRGLALITRACIYSSRYTFTLIYGVTIIMGAEYDMS